jgi:hypothetical protein
MKIIWTILASYLLIGLTLLLVGPLGKALRHAIGDMRLNAQRATLLNGKEPTPTWKVHGVRHFGWAELLDRLANTAARRHRRS